MDLERRNATEADLEAIVDIYNQNIPTRMATADLEPVTVAEKLKWFKSHNPDRRPLWVYTSEDEVVAWVSFQNLKDRYGYRYTSEIGIYVSEDQQGKGLGKRLLKEAVDHCPKLEIKNLVGYIFGHNTRSISLFEKAGFQQWGFLPKVTNLDGIERDVVIMGKRIE